MRPWRPKKQPLKPAAGSPPAPAAAERGGVRTMRIRFVQFALLPPAVGVGILLVVPFLLASSGGPAGGPSGGLPGGRPGAGPGSAGVDLPDAPRAAPSPFARESRRLLDGDVPWQDRVSVAQALGRQYEPAALDALVQASVSRAADTRRIAAYGLVRHLPNPRAQSALAALLDDPDPDVGRTAASAIGTVEHGTYLLLDRLRQPDPGERVHLACLRALPYAGTPDLLPQLMRFVRAGGEVGQAAADTVWTICKRTRTPLPEGLPTPPGRR